MLERRDAKRVALTTPVTLWVGALELKTRMINYSHAGALFIIDPGERSKVSTEILGKDAAFVLTVRNKSDREYTGEIIRFYYEGEEKYIALRFWEPFREISSPRFRSR